MGLGFQIRGVLSVNDVLTYYETSEPGLARLSDIPVVTRYCDPALIMAGKYWEQDIFSATWTGLDAWINHARELEIPAFYVITMDICSSMPLDKVYQNRLTNPTGITANIYQYPDYQPIAVDIPK
jgi:hypothetical protein